MTSGTEGPGRGHRRRGASLVVIALVTAGGVVGFACGFSDEGSFVQPEPAKDSSPPTEASTIPKTDGSMVEDAVADAPAAKKCPPGTSGPAMVLVAGAGFCIDSTEVTNSQYDAFLLATNGGALDAGVPEGGLPSACSGGTFGRKPLGQPDGGTSEFPVSRVSWCDAYAYCAWAGKRLCGGPAPDGDAQAGEWYSGCSKGGVQPHAYGPTYIYGRCNESDVVGFVEPVRSRPLCEGGTPGIFDLSGNLAEWTSSCTDAGVCSASGTFYKTPMPANSCGYAVGYALNYFDLGIGVRCCADSR